MVGHLATLFMLLVLSTAKGAAGDAGITDQGISALATRAMEQFSVPGMAIGIVEAGATRYAQGHGVREVGLSGNIDPKTLFRIASNSKAFTTAALAILVDEGRISWNGLVYDYIPEFRLHDPWITAHFNVIDLLTHRSGLGRGAGDLMLWPEPNAFTHADIIHGLRYFEPVGGFRTKYAYDNLLYIVAGEIIPKVTGQLWGDFVQQRILQPLGMKRCFSAPIPKAEMENLAAPHGVAEGTLAVVERNRIVSKLPVSAAAGGMVCSLDDMITWVKTQLNRGTAPSGATLFSAQQSDMMWRPHTLRSVSERSYELSRTHFKAYALGWRLADVHGYREVSHSGSLDGWRSYVVLVPELELGVIFLSNGSSSPARSIVMNTIVRSFMPVPEQDWFELLAPSKEKDLPDEVVPDLPKPGPRANAVDHQRFVGRYRDPWFGEVTVAGEGGQLVFQSIKSPRMRGELFYQQRDTLLVLWNDRTLESDAFIDFDIGDDGSVRSMTMRPVSADADWSFDYQDLHFLPSR